MEITNAIITNATITNDAHGCLSSWIECKFTNGNQSFGGYSLYLPKTFSHHKIHSVAGHFIWRVMEIADVTEWNQLPGKTIRLYRNDNLIQAIGHIIKDDWFYPKKEFLKED